LINTKSPYHDILSLNYRDSKFLILPINNVCIPLQVYWDGVPEDTVLIAQNARMNSSLIPYVEEGFIIGNLKPTAFVSVIVVAFSYIGGETVGVNIVKHQTYGTGSITLYMMP